MVDPLEIKGKPTETNRLELVPNFQKRPYRCPLVVVVENRRRFPFLTRLFHNLGPSIFEKGGHLCLQMPFWRCLSGPNGNSRFG